MTIRTGHIAVLACTAALVAAGCGSSDDSEGPGVPQAAIAEIDKQLSSLTDRVDVRIPQACADAQDENIPAIQEQVSSLPADTDRDVRSALSESVDKLSTLLDTECQDITDQADREKQQTTTTDTTPQDTETSTTPTETTETNTAPSDEQQKEADKQQKEQEKQQKEQQKQQQKDQNSGGSNPGDGNGGVVSP